MTSGNGRSSRLLGLVDELRLIVNPLLPGGGTRLFDGEDAPKLLTFLGR